MGEHTLFGATYRKWKKGELPADVCEVCGGEMEIDSESGEVHCPLCESHEE